MAMIEYFTFPEVPELKPYNQMQVLVSSSGLSSVGGSESLQRCSRRILLPNRLSNEMIMPYLQKDKQKCRALHEEAGNELISDVLLWTPTHRDKPVLIEHWHTLDAI